jgi:hypothetical protein
VAWGFVGPLMKSSIVKHWILIDGQKISVSLEVTSGRS